jgi:hypothetical protein
LDVTEDNQQTRLAKSETLAFSFLLCVGVWVTTSSSSVNQNLSHAWQISPNITGKETNAFAG